MVMANNLRANVQKLVGLERAKGRAFKPVLITDIDGVLVRGGNPIPDTLQALQMIKQQQIPFGCLTNGGGQLESKKAAKLNAIFGGNLINPDTMFMNHTPLKPILTKYSQKEGNLLITGSLSVKQIVETLNIHNYITADEFYSIFMEEEEQILDKYLENIFYQRQPNRQEVLKQVEERLNRKLGTFQEQSKVVNSIFALNDVSPYEVALRVIHNVLKVKTTMSPISPMQYFASQNDITWASDYPKPRMAFGPFNYIFQNHCKKHKFIFLEHIHYGKPQKKAFEFVQNQMRKVEPQGIFFMVGDNPRADIKGANNIGWYSFLTKTGIHTKDTNDTVNPATFVVQNFHQAICTILQAKKQLLN